MILRKNKKSMLVWGGCAALGLAIGTSAYAGSVHASIDTSQTKASTVTLGNTTGTYRFTVSNGTTSKYNVEAYMYQKPDGGNNNEVLVKKVAVASGDVYSQDHSVNSNSYTMAKAEIYGNKKSNKKTGCVALVSLKNK